MVGGGGVNEARLKPCPFCGGAAEVVTGDVEPQGDPWYGGKTALYVQCGGCGACMFDTYFHEGFCDRESAIATWNRREDPGA